MQDALKPLKNYYSSRLYAQCLFILLQWLVAGKRRETSQTIVDALYGALRVMSASPGNNEQFYFWQ